MEKDNEDPQPQKISPERIRWIIRQLIDIDEEEENYNRQEPERGHSHNEEEE